MIKVLQVVGAMNRGGAELMLMDILRNKDKDIHFDFLVNYNPKTGHSQAAFDEEIESYGCKLYYIPTQFSIGPIAYSRSFKKIVDECQPDIVHSHLNSKSGIIAWAARKAGVKNVIAHCHADIRFRGSKLSNFINETELQMQRRLISRYATHYWGCSKEANRRLFLPKAEKRAVVINNAIDCQKYLEVQTDDVTYLRKSYGFEPDTFILGNIGRIVRHKNVGFILDVIAELRKKGLKSALVVVGREDQKDYVQEIKSKAIDLGCSEYIKFVGEQENVPLYMHSFDMFIGPALKEGFGMVALEAQAAGLPCVLYTGFPRAVDMGLGLVKFQDSFDPSEWASSILSLKDLRNKELVTTCKVISQRGFDSRQNASSVCQKYREIALG